mmetsp:Transcript_7847/g.21857  ORF Transcript_7847/g.21857 Transcript_7847/m.21857 type:complete len:97 (-) Transcript_7847:58-348(-)
MYEALETTTAEQHSVCAWLVATHAIPSRLSAAPRAVAALVGTHSPLQRQISSGRHPTAQSPQHCLQLCDLLPRQEQQYRRYGSFGNNEHTTMTQAR